MKVAVFGSSGLLGSSVCKSVFRRGHTLIPYVNSNKLSLSFDQEQISLDILNEEKLNREIFDIWPDAIINCAAISSPDLVDKNPELAFEVNVNAAHRLALLANHIGSRFIHISSDMVFDGIKPIYRSTDTPNPLTEYGRQKLESEKKILKAGDQIVVLRITIVNGNSPSGQRSPHEKILRFIKEEKQILLFEDEIRQPCSVENVADVIVELLERPQLNGIFHWSGNEKISRYDLGLRILDRFGLNPNYIKKGSSQSAEIHIGPRPKSLIFNLEPLASKLITKPLGIDNQLLELQIPKDLYEWYRNFADDPSVYIPKF